MSKKVTMQDIADSLHVSKVSVHKVLTGQKDISLELKEKIEAKAEELGYIYKKDRLIRNYKFIFLAKRKYFLNTHELFYSTIYKRLQEECEYNKADLLLQFYETEEDIAVIDKLIMENHRISGIFVAGQFSDEKLEKFTKMPIPIVIIDYFSSQYDLNYVYLNSYNDAFRMTNYAIENGHEKIGYIGPLNNDALIDRYFGYRKALLHHKIRYNPEWLISDHLIDEKNVFNTAFPKTLPTVYICHCDYTAIKVIRALQLNDIKVPEDISILSFDDTEGAISMTPSLTTIGISKTEFARNALQLMQTILRNPNEHHSIKMKSVIQERASFLPIKGKKK